MADRTSRSRSPAPAAKTSTSDSHDRLPPRQRSRSPRRRNDGGSNRDRRGRGGGGGFKWKDNSRRDHDRDGEDRRLERGYRHRSRSPRRDRKEDSSSKGNSVEDKFGVADKFGPSTSRKSEDKPNKDAEKPTAATTIQPTGEPIIVVHVNDRLGTKAAIPCLASDNIRLFKAQVAARIGRQPHEILLKRQGERPFKDQLTLEDYGVSNGVQIDLEIDTGE